MCRILAIKNFNYKNHLDLVGAFFQLSKTGKTPANSSSGHKDGWGISYYKNSRPILYKSGNSIINEKIKFFNKTSQIKKSNIVIFHIRKSSWKSTNSKSNSQPFTKDNISFTHNGTWKNYKKYFKESNFLDSEAYFRYTTCDKTTHKFPKNIKNAIIKLKRGGAKYSSLSMVASNGKTLLAYRCFSRNSYYYTLYKTKLRQAEVICSEPILNLKWNLFKPNKFYEF